MKKTFKKKIGIVLTIILILLFLGTVAYFILGSIVLTSIGLAEALMASLIGLWVYLITPND